MLSSSMTFTRPSASDHYDAHSPIGHA